MSIKVSEKHGLNPTLCQCFFCGEVKHIALMGKLKGDVEAPHQCVMDYEPCDKCKEKMSLGVTLIEVTHHSIDGRPSLTAENNIPVYPTGKFAVVKAEAFNRMLNNGQEFKEGQKVFVEETIIDRILGGVQ